MQELTAQAPERAAQVADVPETEKIVQVQQTTVQAPERAAAIADVEEEVHVQHVVLNSPAQVQAKPQTAYSQSSTTKVRRINGVAGMRNSKYGRGKMRKAKRGKKGKRGGCPKF